MAKKNRNGVKVGRVIKFEAIDNFLRNNGGIRAVAYQNGGTFAMLARNGNCTPFFNSDVPNLSIIIGNDRFDSIPVR